MAEPVLPIETTGTGSASPDSAELESLRKKCADLTAKSSNRKATIAERDATIAELQAQLKQSANALESANVTAPLTAMMAALSKHTAVFQEQFLKDYSVQMVNGKLALRSIDGQPITDDKGDEIAFEREAILNLLLNSKDAEKKSLYNALLIVSRASGGDSTFTSQSAATAPKAVAHSFGLR